MPGDGFKRTIRALRKRSEADKLERLGLTAVMWDALVEVYQSRLTPERGKRGTYTDATLNALYRRGLVNMRVLDDAPDVGLWFTTDKGADLAKQGPE